MNAPAKIEASPLAKLREKFEPHQISKLPKPLSRDAKKGKCAECGGYHGLPAIHLDYVGHAALTDRLLETDPLWFWEPLALDDRGLPALDQNGGLWIRLTVCGHTRLGYGHAGDKRGGDAIKELIGDALRNAAMRFGAALDLWHKGDLHVDDGGDDQGQGQSGEVSPGAPAEYTFPAGPAANITQLKTMARGFWREIEGCGDSSELEPFLALPDSKAFIAQMEKLEKPDHRAIYYGDGGDNPGIKGLIERKRKLFDMEAVSGGAYQEEAA